MSLLTFLFPSTAVELLSGTFLDPDEEGALPEERKLLSADRAAVSVSTGGRAGAGGVSGPRTAISGLLAPSPGRLQNCLCTGKASGKKR